MGESFEEKIEKACMNKDIPGAVLFASNKDGSFKYQKAFGTRSLKDPSTIDPMPLDAVMWLASCTKLVTTIATLQCVERGLVTLDEDITNILTELKNAEILTGFEDGTEKPILVKNTKTMTLRHLLTHSSGLSYDIFHPMLLRYRASQGRTPELSGASTVSEAGNFPLLFAPGEEWGYGVGIDWAGQVVERVNNKISLDEYVQKNIWRPLNVKSFSFFPGKHPEIMSKLVDMSMREGGVNMFGLAQDPKGKVVHSPTRVFDPVGAVDSWGGAGGFAAPVDYQKLLQSILCDDGKLLKSATIDEMFKPQLSESAQKSLMQTLAVPELNQQYGRFPAGTRMSWGLGGITNLDDFPGRRRKGSLSWGGYPNLVWFIDRETGLNGIYGSNLIPAGDLQSFDLFESWEADLYKSVPQKPKI